jgi:dihydroflavonol-4-reductase
MSSRAAAFITGGSGVVGRALVRELVATGREVRALGRSDAARATVAELGARPIPGDVESVDEMAAAMKGCDSVFHLAGVNALCVSDPSNLFGINILGSLNVVTAAANANVPRLIYTSSASTLGEKRGTVGHEGSTHRGYFLSEYERSKYEAEKVVVKAARELGIEMVGVNPSSVQGPGRSGGTGRILVMYLRGRLKFFVRTQISVVDIDDCARGHILAESNGRAGQRYVLNSGTLPIQEALAIVRRLAGRGPKAHLVPGPLAMVAATVAEVAARAMGRSPAVCREMVRTLLHGHTYDGSKAERELGLRYTPIEVTLDRTIRWLRSEGLVPD